MARKQYTEEQIVHILKEAAAGLPIGELCRKYGISDATFYNWRTKYADMTVSDIKKLRALVEENAKLMLTAVRTSPVSRGLKSPGSRALPIHHFAFG